MKTTLVNLGCGGRYHAAWLNFDLNPISPEIQACDLSKGVPLPDGYCDAVFNSALLEHLRPRDARSFLSECRRILKPGGVLRIGIPDLEQIAKIYLNKLDACAGGDDSQSPDYDWILLELLDQMVREKSGGAMAEYIAKSTPNEAFIKSRIGTEFTHLKSELTSSRGTYQRFLDLPPHVRRYKILQRIRRIPNLIRRAIARCVLSRDDREALKLGRLRLSGELHLWMYDRYSLPRLLREVGFQNPRVAPRGKSSIDGWENFHLDLSTEGEPLKPDLLYIECNK